MGKGSDYRPCNKKKFDSNFDAIFGEKNVLDFHKDKTRGLNISWPSVEDNRKTTKQIVCTICDHKYIRGETEPCSHIKKLLEQ